MVRCSVAGCEFNTTKSNNHLKCIDLHKACFMCKRIYGKHMLEVHNQTVEGISVPDRTLKRIKEAEEEIIVGGEPEKINEFYLQASEGKKVDRSVNDLTCPECKGLINTVDGRGVGRSIYYECDSCKKVFNNKFDIIYNFKLLEPGKESGKVDEKPPVKVPDEFKDNIDVFKPPGDISPPTVPRIGAGAGFGDTTSFSPTPGQPLPESSTEGMTVQELLKKIANILVWPVVKAYTIKIRHKLEEEYSLKEDDLSKRRLALEAEYNHLFTQAEEAYRSKNAELANKEVYLEERRKYYDDIENNYRDVAVKFKELLELEDKYKKLVADNTSLVTQTNELRRAVLLKDGVLAKQEAKISMLLERVSQLKVELKEYQSRPGGGKSQQDEIADIKASLSELKKGVFIQKAEDVDTLDKLMVVSDPRERFIKALCITGKMDALRTLQDFAFSFDIPLEDINRFWHELVQSGIYTDGNGAVWKPKYREIKDADSKKICVMLEQLSH